MSTDKPPETQNQEVILTADVNDITENKIMAALAYLGILFIVPLVAAKSSPYARFHTAQGFVLFLGWVIVALVGWIPLLGWLVGFLGGILLIVLSVMGVVNALQGKMKKLPLLGDIKFS